MKNYSIDKDGIKLIIDREGLKLTAYLDKKKGVPTIGIGHTKGVKIGDVITEQQAYELFKEDSNWVLNCINSTNLELNQNQVNALFCLIFNIGVGAFISSTVYRYIRLKANRKDIENAWSWWCKDQNEKGVLEIVPGLVIRRKIEYTLYFKPI